jgi:MGT family glycosyltransferase
VVARWRRKWDLPPHRDPAESFSRLAQISQQPPAFDFPRRELPPHFHYVGPLRNPSGIEVPFPWERLDGRPLVYASLGTLQFSKGSVFRAFAAACASLDLQLVLAHCGGLDAQAVASLPGAPVAVHYAPQLQILARARLALTHAGLNTVLDSLSCGVPLVAVPITYEQPAIAARLQYTGTGLSLALRSVTPERLRSAMDAVLGAPSYSANALRVAQSIRSAGGAAKAAGIIEGLLPEWRPEDRSGT